MVGAAGVAGKTVSFTPSTSASFKSGLRARSIAPISTWSSAGGITPTVRFARPASRIGSQSRNGSRLVGKRQRQIVQPRIHLVPDGLVDCRLPIADCRFFVVERPAFQGCFDFQIAPEFAQGFGQLCAVRARFGFGELRGKFSNGGKMILRSCSTVFVRQRLAPFFAAPAEFERGVFQPVNFRLRHGRKSGLERGEPVVVLPVERDGAERAAGEFGERVMRDGFAAVEKKRNSVAAKRARERLVISRRDCGRARRNRGNGLPARTNFKISRAAKMASASALAQAMTRNGGLRIVEVLDSAAGSARSSLLPVLQAGAFGKTAFARIALENFDCRFCSPADFPSAGGIVERICRRPTRSKARNFLGSRAGFIQAEGERGVFAEREDRGEQIQFLRRHFGKTVEPQAVEF